ncbi:hypothetical protein HPB51_007648 [Rhipicephalus microplus]|uniref:Uncharacterized protein n=1 Tax=Rhipicephalus microplus TaxID=6941 RepID=A0A9J6EFS9_RHIMP|nr:hypothetical protein HPB51_007648 [Rhipicephalus microplus]
MRVLANKIARLVQNLDKLSTPEKLIFDQSVMKANAKSPRAASSLKADFGFESTLFTVLKDKLQVFPEKERRGVLMFDEVSVRVCTLGSQTWLCLERLTSPSTQDPRTVRKMAITFWSFSSNHFLEGGRRLLGPFALPVQPPVQSYRSCCSSALCTFRTLVLLMMRLQATIQHEIVQL